jgi:hypothetical protein
LNEPSKVSPDTVQCNHTDGWSLSAGSRAAIETSQNNNDGSSNSKQDSRCNENADRVEHCDRQEIQENERKDLREVQEFAVRHQVHNQGEVPACANRSECLSRSI